MFFFYYSLQHCCKSVAVKLQWLQSACFHPDATVELSSLKFHFFIDWDNKPSGFVYLMSISPVLTWILPILTSFSLQVKLWLLRTQCWTQPIENATITTVIVFFFYLLKIHAKRSRCQRQQSIVARYTEQHRVREYVEIWPSLKTKCTSRVSEKSSCMREKQAICISLFVAPVQSCKFWLL